MEGRGLYTGARAWGLYAEYDQNGGFNWGGKIYANASYDSEKGFDFHHTGQDVKKSFDDFTDMLKQKHYERFDKQAEWEKDLDTFDKFLSYCLDIGGEACTILEGVEARDHNIKGDDTNIKAMISSDWSSWNPITNRYTDIELIYNRKTGALVTNWARGSYNYGHNVITHFFLDYIPHHIWENPY